MAKAPRRGDQERLLSLLATIYGALLDPREWDTALHDLCAATAAERAILAPGPPSGRSGNLLGACGVDEETFRPYYEHYGSQDPLLPAGTRFAPEEPFTTEDLLSRTGMDWSGFRRTEIYADFLRPQKMERVLGGHLPLGEQDFAALGLYRPEESPWDAGERRLLREVMPHLHRALQIALRMDVLRDRLEATRELVDELACGAILVAGDGRVLDCNRAARELAAADDGFRLTSEGVTASGARQARRLRELVLGAARTGSGERGSAGGALSLERPSGRRPYQVSVSPLAHRSAAARWGLGASALVLVSDPDVSPRPPEELLRAFWGLTPAEARVAVRIASGASLGETGEALGIRRETIRNHLKRIYEKTGTHRQAELVNLVHALPSPPRSR